MLDQVMPFLDIGRPPPDSASTDLANAYLDRCLSLLSNEGDLTDPHAGILGAEQYGSSFLAFAFALKYSVEKNPDWGKRARHVARKTLKRLKGRLATSDQIFSLTLTALFLDDTEIQEAVSLLSFSSQEESLDGNNNYCLRLLCEVLRARLSSHSSTQSIEKQFDRCVANWSRGGVFIDFPRQPKSPTESLAPLAYFPRFLWILLWMGVLLKRKDWIDCGHEGLKKFDSLIASDGEAFYYGRSLNAVYGYANGIFAAGLAASLAEEKEDRTVATRVQSRLEAYLQNFRKGNQAPTIVPNVEDPQPCGYDIYMYWSVYAAYSAGLLLFTQRLRQASTPTEPRDTVSVLHIHEAGYLTVKGELELGLHMKGGYYFEPKNGVGLGATYAPHSLLYIKFRGLDWLPSLPTVQPQRWDSWPRHLNTVWAGFFPSAHDGDDWWVPGPATQVSCRSQGNKHLIEMKSAWVKLHLPGQSWLKRIPLALLRRTPFRQWMRIPDVNPYENVSIGYEPDGHFKRKIVIGRKSVLFYDDLAWPRSAPQTSQVWLTTLRMFSKLCENSSPDRLSQNGVSLEIKSQNREWEKYGSFSTSKGPMTLFVQRGKLSQTQSFSGFEFNVDPGTESELPALQRWAER